MRKNPLKILLALAIGLFLAEGLLWGAHAVFGAVDRAGGGGGDILCIGDSHTFGWNVDAASAYPAQLEALLGADGLDVHVTNRGAPGKNTTTLLEELDEYLALDAPQVVLILAGINNPWSRPPAEDGGDPGVLERTRLAKFTRILWARLAGESRGIGTGDGEGAGSIEELELESGKTQVRVTNREGVVETFEVGGGNISHAETKLAYQWIKKDLGTLAARVREYGATPVVMTYAVENSDLIRAVNNTIRVAAQEHAIPFVDVAGVMAPEVEAFGKARLVFPDAHPRVEGYQVVARILHDGLVEQGLFDAAPLGDPFAPLRAAEAPRPVVELQPTPDGGVTLELTYDPVLDFSVLMAFEAQAPGVAKPWYGIEVGLAQDALFKASAQSELLRGRFDVEGRAWVDLSRAQLQALVAQALPDVPAAELEARLAAQPLFVQLVARTAGWTPLATSEVITLR